MRGSDTQERYLAECIRGPSLSRWWGVGGYRSRRGRRQLAPLDDGEGRRSTTSQFIVAERRLVALKTQVAEPTAYRP
jgi:hypothetical protein